jgi:hypothetical protein
MNHPLVAALGTDLFPTVIREVLHIVPVKPKLKNRL